jgi:hypothetical protein
MALIGTAGNPALHSCVLCIVQSVFSVALPQGEYLVNER